MGENAIFPIRVTRGNEMIFEQCESALIVRAKFVNMHKIRGIFWQNISFKKNIKYLQALFSRSVFFILLFYIQFGLLFIVCFISYLHCLFNKDKEFRVNAYICRSVNIYCRKLHYPLIKLVRKFSVSNYFSIKYGIFDKNFGSCSTVTSLVFNTIAYLSCTSAPVLVSWLAFYSLSICTFHLIW